MKTNSHRNPATSASSIRRRRGTGKDEFHLVPFVPLSWARNHTRVGQASSLSPNDDGFPNGLLLGNQMLSNVDKSGPSAFGTGWKRCPTATVRSKPASEVCGRWGLITDAVERVPTGVHCAIRDRQSEISAAFTRAELLITLAVLSLLVAIVLPALAHDRARSARIICANNLRQISVAQQLWGNDHNDFPPVMVPLNEGGTRGHPLAANAWLHFAWLSNELVTPKVIFCPSDTGKPAEEFTGSPTNGYLNPNFANRATSYFVGYSGSNTDLPQGIIGGDRNVTIDGTSLCPNFNVPSRIDRLGGQWTTNLHNLVGNAQARDGSVEMLSSEEMQARMLTQLDFFAQKHIAIPR